MPSPRLNGFNVVQVTPTYTSGYLPGYPQYIDARPVNAAYATQMGITGNLGQNIQSATTTSVVWGTT